MSVHNRELKALDQTLTDLSNNQDPFGSTMILLASDFHQMPSVIPRSTAIDEINVSI